MKWRLNENRGNGVYTDYILRDANDHELETIICTIKGKTITCNIKCVSCRKKQGDSKSNKDNLTMKLNLLALTFACQAS